MNKEELIKMRRESYRAGYEQGRFDERMESKPPTAEQEVIDKLSEYLGEPVWIDSYDYIRIASQRLVKKVYYNNKYKGLDIQVVLPPHLITLIGRFYEGKAHNE
jgi:hypothetical protein